MVDLLFVLIFITGVYYLVQYRLNLKKAADTARTAIYPESAEEFSGILLPGEWLEMEPLTKDSKSYRIVNWGTYAALVLLSLLLWAVLATDWGETSFFSVAYIFFILISAIRHRGNFFILPKGIILNARYYSFSQIKCYETERIIRWHELYGLDSRADNGYKVAFKIKNKLFQPNFIVVENAEQLQKISSLLEKNGVEGRETKTS
ncbi:hypothetical protein [Bacillus sp. AK031]